MREVRNAKSQGDVKTNGFDAQTIQLSFTRIASRASTHRIEQKTADLIMHSLHTRAHIDRAPASMNEAVADPASRIATRCANAFREYARIVAQRIVLDTDRQHRWQAVEAIRIEWKHPRRR